MRIGVHVSIAGKIDEAIDRAAALGCETIQIFSRNPRTWRSKPLEAEEVKSFKEKRLQYNIYPVLVHIPYLINLATPKSELWKISINSYIEDIIRTDTLGAEYFVTHLGAHTGSGMDAGLKKFCRGLSAVIKKAKPKTMILLETCAGEGTSLGSRFEHIRYILDNVKSKNIGVCWDTCHLYAAGYDIKSSKGLNNTIKEFEKKVGLKYLKAIHLNDAKKPLGSKVDRHEHIGEGMIGKDGMRRILNHPKLKVLPFIMETPKGNPEDDLKNIGIVRRLTCLVTGKTR
jgi:deoxyribonuclease-4